jgi:hypothetical protein
LTFSYWTDIPWFLTKGKLVVVLITPSLGVPNWSVIYIINTAPPRITGDSDSPERVRVRVRVRTSGRESEERGQPARPGWSGLTSWVDLTSGPRLSTAHFFVFDLFY